MRISVRTDRSSPTVKIETGHRSLPIYDEACEVTPSATEEIVLPTKDTVVKSDITVHPIPYSLVSNKSGGRTANIG